MIKAIIIDDEFNAIKNLKWEIENFSSDIQICDTFTNPLEAISAINYLKPDCVFLDIEMPEMDGFQLLNRLDYRDFDLIITTAYDNYAIKAFKEHAIDYLLKPIDSEDLNKTLDRVKKNKAHNTHGEEVKKIVEDLSNATNNLKRLALPLIGRTVFVEFEDIVFCKSDGNYTDIHLVNNQKETVSKKLKDIESQLNHNFFRIHHSYLVNLNAVKEVVTTNGNQVILKSGTSLPVSRSNKSELLQRLKQ